MMLNRPRPKVTEEDAIAATEAKIIARREYDALLEHSAVPSTVREEAEYEVALIRARKKLDEAAVAAYQTLVAAGIIEGTETY